MTDAVSNIRARREEIAGTIEQLKAEDRELATAEVVLKRLAGAQPAQSAGSGDRRRTAPPAAYAARGAPKSQRSLVIQLLSSCEPAWLRSTDIVEKVKDRWGVEIPERSLRPLLSAMKRERVIARSGRQVALIDRA